MANINNNFKVKNGLDVTEGITAAELTVNSATITVNNVAVGFTATGITLDGTPFSGGGGGSYDQSLNTTDQVTFAKVTATNGVVFPQGGKVFEYSDGTALVDPSGTYWVTVNHPFYNEPFAVYGGGGPSTGSEIFRIRGKVFDFGDANTTPVTQLISGGSDEMSFGNYNTAYSAVSARSTRHDLGFRVVSPNNEWVAPNGRELLWMTTATSTVSTQLNVLENLTVRGHILPSANDTYDLGSSSTQWRSLYVGTTTIYIGGNSLSIINGALNVNGQPIGGGTPYAITRQEVSGNTTLSTSTALFVLATGAGGYTVTLPQTTGVTGVQEIRIKNKTTGTLTIATSNSELIDDDATLILEQPNSSVILTSNTSSWAIF